MKKVFICSPYRGDYERNLKLARRYSFFAFVQKCVPVTPHIFYDTILDDTDVYEREMGMRAGLELLLVCDELWAFGTPTEGMQAEIEKATELGIPIVRFNVEIEKEIEELEDI